LIFFLKTKLFILKIFLIPIKYFILRESIGFETVKINSKTTALETIQMALEKFEINVNIINYLSFKYL
jgi:hypothetical protein